MATALQAPAPQAVNTGNRLLPASITAALFLLVGVAAVGYGIPKLLAEVLPGSGMVNVFFRVLIQIAALVGIVIVGGKLAGANPPRGIRGGIFVVLSVIFTVFFLWRAVGLNFTNQVGQIIAVVVTLGLLFAAFKFLTSATAREWMIGLEDMGWFHTYSYKRTQGLKMRRYTIIGILLLGLSGVYTLMSQELLGAGDLTMRIPYIDHPVAVLADQRFAVPLLLTAAILWLAWRAVNMPMFADFLIATEAEMNKVSWTPRRRLIQDTIVVLVTTLLLTAFLLVIDLFWGWLLSLSFIGVLPNKSDLESLQKQQTPATEQQKW